MEFINFLICALIAFIGVSVGCYALGYVLGIVLFVLSEIFTPKVILGVIITAILVHFIGLVWAIICAGVVIIMAITHAVAKRNIKATNEQESDWL